ncbi:hypothetical protein ABIE21_003227 [Conyzicola nivalis]|uniref:Septum formation-related domain-containing protein n=2 Tax=Conyzicola nivalis TaxID=1477021 RepID=A0ABV2QRJ2_9MICO
MKVEPMSALRLPSRLALASVVALAAVASLGGCAVLENIFPAQAERDAETQQIAEAGQQDVFTVALGDCFNNDAAAIDNEEISDLPAVPCAEPHDNEVFLLFDLAGDEFPVDVDQLADDGCFAQFETFVGMPYETSVLDYFPIQPTVETWAEGDREVICSVFEPEVQTTGTLAGAAR